MHYKSSSLKFTLTNFVFQHPTESSRFYESSGPQICLVASASLHLLTIKSDGNSGKPLSLGAGERFV